MNQIARTLAGLALGCCLAGNVAQAATIQSMTIEEIGVASGGIGISEAFNGGGFGDWVPPPNTPYTLSPSFFVSAGSADGSILVGNLQANGQFTLGTTWNGIEVFFNTLHGAPTGTIENGIMSLDLSGLYADLPSVDLTFNLAPTVGPITAVTAIDANHYYYAVDWVHLVNNDVYHITSGIQALGWNGSQVIMHLEGIATLAPVPEAEIYAMMLAGLGLVGLIAHRRRKLLNVLAL